MLRERGGWREGGKWKKGDGGEGGERKRGEGVNTATKNKPVQKHCGIIILHVKRGRGEREGRE